MMVSDKKSTLILYIQVSGKTFGRKHIYDFVFQFPEKMTEGSLSFSS